MRVLRLIIKNIGLIADSTLELNEPLLVLYGEIQQGKTTFLNAVRWCFGGSFPSDIIRHGQEGASIKLEFENGFIERSFYRAKDGTTKARDVRFVRDGKPVGRPTEEIRRFLNPFLLDQDYLRNMTELERKKYFIELFDIKTLDLDNEISRLGQEAHELRLKVRGYGDIDITPVQKVDSAALKQRLAFLRADNEHVAAAHQAGSDAIREHNQSVKDASASLDSWEKKAKQLESQIEELNRQLSNARHEAAVAQDFLSTNVLTPEPPAPAFADTSGIESQIEQGAAQNVRHEAYLERVKLLEKKTQEEGGILEIEAKQRILRAAKIARLQEVSDQSGIPGLVFTDDGGFTYHGTQAGMLSTSQVMDLSSRLSWLYPEGFGLDLIDRGESLGKSIFKLIERAKQEDKTILATVVGEKPATAPDEVGVFVVEQGRVS